MRGLYAIVDVGTLRARGLDVQRFADAVLEASPCALQLRGKSLCSLETLSLLRSLVPRCKAKGVPLFANDRPELAVLAGCDGVHVGQTDMPLERVRRLSSALLVGVSTHRLSELDLALSGGPDYVAFGPVFSTDTKRDAEPNVGLDGLRDASARARQCGVPLVAIGGISVDRAPSVAPHVDMVAVIAGLYGEATSAEAYRDASARAQAYRQAFAPS